MSGEGGRYFRFCVVLEGWELYAFTRVLRRHLPELLEPLQPALRSPLEDRFAECEAMSREWADWRRGTAEPLSAGPAVESTSMKDTLTTDQAAGLLHVSDRYVRKLVACGTLPAQLERGRWQIAAGAVYAYKEEPCSSAPSKPRKPPWTPGSP